MNAKGSAPVIETERLVLRGRTLDDFPFIRDMWRHPETTRYIGGEPLSEEASWTKFLRMIGHWQALGFGYWMIEERSSGETVGECGFADFRRDIEPSLHDQPEMGWAIDPRHHGKGYASEASKAAIAWGDANFFDKRFCCIISTGNAPSLRIAEKCGFRRGPQTVYHGDDVFVLYRDGAG